MTHNVWLFGIPWFAWYWGLGFILSIGLFGIYDLLAGRFENFVQFKPETLVVVCCIVASIFAIYTINLPHP